MKQWLTASEIGKLKLPGLPSSKVAIAARAEREKWPMKAGTGLGGPRNLYQVPDDYILDAESGTVTQIQLKRQVYDPTAGSGEMLKAAVDYVAKARAEGQMDDAELIREVVLGVENWLQRNNAHPDAEKKAALISLLFRYFQTDGALDKAKMDKLLTAIA